MENPFCYCCYLSHPHMVIEMRSYSPRLGFSRRRGGIGTASKFDLIGFQRKISEWDGLK